MGNLQGGGGVLEGIERDQCDGAGGCAMMARDCRDYGGLGFCSKSSAFFSWCAGCTPDRATCVDLSEPCSCE